MMIELRKLQRAATVVVHIFALGGLLMLLVYTLAFRTESINTEPLDPSLALQTFPVGAGWGYAIWADDHMVIRQAHIPAITGVHAFWSEGDAFRTGTLVLNKLERRQLPTITRAELDSLQIDLSNQ